MARFTRWLRHEYDAVITLVVAAVAVVLRILGVLNESQLSPVILIVLALLAYTIVRERMHAEAVARAAHAVRELNSFDIRREYEEARRRTNQWKFKGGTGTYLRAVTLPHCIRNAEHDRRDLLIQIEIIDPTVEELCDYYARHRLLNPDGTGERWTTRRARNEAYATILAACWYLQRFRAFLTIGVALSETVPTFRWDLASDCVMVTHEDASPHLMFGKSSPHYNVYDRALNSSFRQARSVPLEKAKVRLSNEPTATEARAVFRELGLELPQSMPDNEVEDIIRRAVHARNPYP